jgi:hypothetical protein
VCPRRNLCHPMVPKCNAWTGVFDLCYY